MYYRRGYTKTSDHPYSTPPIPTHLLIKNVHTPRPTQNISPTTHTHIHLLIKNNHLPKIYLKPTPPTHKKCPTTPSPKIYLELHPPIPDRPIKKCPKNFTSTHPYPSIKMSRNLHPPKIYLHLPPTTSKLNKLVF